MRKLIRLLMLLVLVCLLSACSTGAKPAQVGYWMFRGNWAVVMRNAIARVYNLQKPTSLPW